MKITNEKISREYDNFCANLIPFGIRRAVEVAIEAGEDGDWAAEQIEQFAEETGGSIKDCDPVYCVYDSILQEARNEIDDLINFDFCNDGAEIYTYGNFMATSYDWSDDAPQKIKEKLIENEIDFNDLTTMTQWFLKEIEANY